MAQDPQDLYAAMRAQHGPVVPVELTGGVPAWLVVGYREAAQVLRDGYLFSRDSRLWRFSRDGLVPQGWPLEPHTAWRPNVLFAEREEHVRLRGALTRSFKNVGLGHVGRFAAKAGNELIDGFCLDGHADLVAQYAAPLPLKVLMRLFGFPPATTTWLQAAIPALLEGGDSAREADAQIMDIIAGHVARRRAESGADLVAWLVEDEAELSDDEVRDQVWLTLNAGMPATSNWIANTAEQLMSRRGMHLGVNSGYMDIQGAMKATLWQRPPVENVIGRWAVSDVELGGTMIRAGDMVILSLGAANLSDHCGADGKPIPRDSYTDHNESHLAFGAGRHECPVPDLARLITRVAVESLWTRLPDVHLSDPEQPRDWGPSIIVRALRTLPVSFGAVRASADAQVASARAGGH
ncbi:cytochrome P450 [Streptomyces spectabilis]|uniref:cytochrome P450 n=1 Tax=Streptomyces spectabilis TaxID=68270 RepID=UPI00340C093E